MKEEEGRDGFADKGEMWVEGDGFFKMRKSSGQGGLCGEIYWLMYVHPYPPFPFVLGTTLQLQFLEVELLGARYLFSNNLSIPRYFHHATNGKSCRLVNLVFSVVGGKKIVGLLACV